MNIGLSSKTISSRYGVEYEHLTNCYFLTLFDGGVGNIRSRGGALNAPLMFSLKLTFLGPKNDKTIYPHIFEDLMEGSELKHPPSGPQKP